jgi:hypothetical protein
MLRQPDARMHQAQFEARCRLCRHQCSPGSLHEGWPGRNLHQPPHGFVISICEC